MSEETKQKLEEKLPTLEEWEDTELETSGC